MKKLLFSAVFGILGLAFPASLRAQFIGYTTPQSVQLKILNAVTVPTTANIPNIGQSVHSLTYTAASCTGVDIRLEASNDGVNFFAISADATDTAPNPIGGVTGTGGVTAVGYYPVVRVNLLIVTGGGCAVTAFYAGTSTIQPTPTQINQQAAGYRFPVTFNTVTSNAFTTIALPTPYGSSQGSVWIQCSAACASGGALTVFVSPADSPSIGSIQVFAHAIGTVATLQRFDIPAYSANRVFVSLTPTAASANTWTVLYNFSGQPQASPSLSFTNGSVLNSQAGTTFGIPVCENFVPISTTANVQLISGVAGQTIYICSVNVVVASADNVAVVEGTGVTCGTGTAGIFGGTTAATGWNLAANGQVSFGHGVGMIGKTGNLGDNVCLLVSAAVQASGGITWTRF